MLILDEKNLEYKGSLNFVKIGLILSYYYKLELKDLKHYDLLMKRFLELIKDKS